jgi:protein SCO1/2
MRAQQWILTAMAGVAGFAVAALCVVFVFAGRHDGQAGGAVSIGGPFALVDDTGAPVTDKTLAGKPYVMYFGYTYCPEFCPTTLLDLSRWIKQLGPDADKLNYVLVTIDPERDTPQLMHLYLSSFDKHIRGFTGTPEQIAKIAKEYRVYYIFFFKQKTAYEIQFGDWSSDVCSSDLDRHAARSHAALLPRDRKSVV